MGKRKTDNTGQGLLAAKETVRATKTVVYESPPVPRFTVEEHKEKQSSLNKVPIKFSFFNLKSVDLISVYYKTSEQSTAYQLFVSPVGGVEELTVVKELSLNKLKTTFDFYAEFCSQFKVTSTEENHLTISRAPQQSSFLLSPKVSLQEITEDRWADAIQGELSSIKVSFSNLKIKTGDLSAAKIELSTISGYAHTAQVGIPLGADTYEVIIKVDIKEKPTNLKARITFLDSKNLQIKNPAGAIAECNSELIIDGVEDIRYPALAPDLQAVNEDGMFGGLQLNTNVIGVTWSDITKKDATFFPYHSVNLIGQDVSLTQEQCRRVFRYKVYLYLSKTETPPVNSYPVTDPADEGEWVMTTETLDTFISLRVPASTYFWIWVGMETRTTLTAEEVSIDGKAGSGEGIVPLVARKGVF